MRSQWINIWRGSSWVKTKCIAMISRIVFTSWEFLTSGITFQEMWKWLWLTGTWEAFTQVAPFFYENVVPFPRGKPLNFKLLSLGPKEGQMVQHVRGTEQSLASVETKKFHVLTTFWLENCSSACFLRLVSLYFSYQPETERLTDLRDAFPPCPGSENALI